MQSATESSGGGYFIPCLAPLQFLKLSLYVKQPKFAPGMDGRRSPAEDGGAKQRCARLDAPESLIKSDIVSPPTKTVELRRELILEFANFNMPVSYPGL